MITWNTLILPDDEEAAVRAVRQILLQLYGLADLGFADGKLDRIRREAIFFLYEGGDAAKWDFRRPHSAAARRLRVEAQATGCHLLSTRKAITYEHAIPLRCLRQGLREASISDDRMRAFLRQHVHGIVITREEDKRLTTAGLRSRMPEGAAADDLLARYRSVGIAFDPADKALLHERQGCN